MSPHIQLFSWSWILTVIALLSSDISAGSYNNYNLGRNDSYGDEAGAAATAGSAASSSQAAAGTALSSSLSPLSSSALMFLPPAIPLVPVGANNVAPSVAAVAELDLKKNCFITMIDGVPVSQCMTPAINSDGTYTQAAQTVTNTDRWMPADQYSRDVGFSQSGAGSALEANVTSKVTARIVQSNMDSPLAAEMRTQIRSEISSNVLADIEKNNPNASADQIEAAIQAQTESMLPLRLSKNLGGQINDQVQTEMIRIRSVEKQRAQVLDQVRNDSEVLSGPALEAAVDSKMQSLGFDMSYRQNAGAVSTTPVIDPCGATAKVAAVTADGLKYLCKNTGTTGDKAGRTFVMQRGKKDEKKIAETGVDDSVNFKMLIDPASPCAKIPKVTSSQVSEDGKSYYCGQSGSNAVVMTFNETSGKWQPKVIDSKKQSQLGDRNTEIANNNTRELGMDKKVVISPSTINVYVDNGNGCEKKAGQIWLSAGQPLIFDAVLWQDECYRDHVLSPLGLGAGRYDRRLTAKGNMICDVKKSPYGGTFYKAAEPPGKQECVDSAGKFNCAQKGGNGRVSVEDHGLGAQDYFSANRICAQRQAFSPLLDENKQSVIQDGACNFYSYDPVSCCLVTQTTNGPVTNPTCKSQADKDTKDIQSKADALTGVGSYGLADPATGKVKKDAIDNLLGGDMKDCLGKNAFDPAKNLECAAKMSETLAQREAIAGVALLALGAYTLTQCKENPAQSASGTATASSGGMSTGAMIGIGMVGLPVLMGVMGSMNGKSSNESSSSSSADDDMKKRISGIQEANTSTVTTNPVVRTSTTAATNYRTPSSAATSSSPSVPASSVSNDQAQQDQNAQAQAYQQRANPMKPYNDCAASSQGDLRLLEECKSLLPAASTDP